jgi:hypothetical protein
MEQIIFDIFKYKLIADNQKIVFMYNNQKVSEAYWADIVAKALIEDVRITSLIRSMLNLPDIISISDLYANDNLLFDDMNMLRRSIRSKYSSKTSLDKIMKVIRICRNYAVDYSGLYTVANRFKFNNWNITASKADSACSGFCTKHIDISLNDANVKSLVSVQAKNIAFELYFDASRYNASLIDKENLEAIAIELALYYIVKATKRSINEATHLIGIDLEMVPHIIAYYNSWKMLSLFMERFADEIPTGMTLRNRTDDIEHTLSDVEFVDARRNSNEKLHRHIQLQNSI